jgi:HemK-related putative methylase
VTGQHPKGLRRSAWSRLRWWRFRLFQRHRHDRPVLETVAGRPILVLPSVLNPVLFETGRFLAETLVEEDPSGFGKPEGSGPVLIPPGATVLDMGTGTGIAAVFAADRATRVVAVDINPQAVRCARINALLNRVDDRVQVLHGDLFAPVQDERFDVVLFNPPYFVGEPRTDFERALRSGDLGERFAAGLAGHLAPGGRLLLLLSTDGDESGWLAALRANGFDHQVVAQRDLRSEVLTIHRIARHG